MIARILGFVVFVAIVALLVLNGRQIIEFSVAQGLKNSTQASVKAGNWPNAIKEYEKGVKENPDNLAVALRLGWLYLKNNQPGKAEALYKSILKVQPDSLEAQVGLANAIQRDASRLNEAVDVYRAALKKHADDPQLLNDIGNLYKRAAENPDLEHPEMRSWLYDNARYYYGHALAVKPESFQSNFNLGVAWQNLGNLKPASRAYCRAIELRPNSYEARYNLGLVLVDLNYLDEGYRQLNRSIDILREQGDMATAQKMAVRVQQIKNSVFNSPDRSGLSSEEAPPFLGAGCLLDQGDTAKKKNNR